MHLHKKVLHTQVFVVLLFSNHCCTCSSFTSHMEKWTHTVLSTNLNVSVLAYICRYVPLCELHLCTTLFMKTEVSTVVKAQTVVFWIMTLCSLVADYWHFGRTSSLHVQGRWKQHVPTEVSVPPTWLHDITTWKTKTWTVLLWKVKMSVTYCNQFYCFWNMLLNLGQKHLFNLVNVQNYLKGIGLLSVSLGSMLTYQHVYREWKIYVSFWTRIW
jgi:hypothetical protein